MTQKSLKRNDSIEMPDNVESTEDLPLIWEYSLSTNKFNYELRRVSTSRNIAVLIRENTDLRHLDDGRHPRKIVKVGKLEFEELVYTDLDGVEQVHTPSEEDVAIEYYGDWTSTGGVDGASIMDYTRTSDMFILECENKQHMKFTVRIRFEQTLESITLQSAINQL